MAAWCHDGTGAASIEPRGIEPRRIGSGHEDSHRAGVAAGAAGICAYRGTGSRRRASPARAATVAMATARPPTAMPSQSGDEVMLANVVRLP